MFRPVAGRPVLPRLDLAAQRRRTMSRCQRRIVYGVTSSRSPWRRALGITASRVASSARSAQSRSGRCGCRRCRTVSWWRRIRISAVFDVSSRWDSRSHVVSRVIRRKTNRRHMTGDHHGRTARRATLLVTAADEILGTHRFGRQYRGLGAGARAVLDAARRDGKLTGPERDITVSHLDGDLSADDREELGGYRSGRCQLNSPWSCTIRASLLSDFVVFVRRPVELTVQNRTLPYAIGATLES